MAKKRRSSQFKDTSQVIDIEEARRKRQEKRQKQQKHRENQEQTAQKRAAKSRVKAGRRKKYITYTAVILFIIAVIGASVLNIITLKAEYKEAELANQQLQQQKEELEQQIKDSGKDKFIEEEARKQLRMVKPGESVYIVPNQEQPDEAAEAESEKE